SRLRVNLKQIEVIKSDAYFKNLGASGILKKGNSVQIVFGGLSDNIKMEIDKLM
ncbi:PTS glucose transporter subunit IIB, partial [Borreliella burgdorferi]